MKIILDQLQVQTKQSNERIGFSDTITYIRSGWKRKIYVGTSD